MHFIVVSPSIGAAIFICDVNDLPVCNVRSPRCDDLSHGITFVDHQTGVRNHIRRFYIVDRTRRMWGIHEVCVVSRGLRSAIEYDEIFLDLRYRSILSTSGVINGGTRIMLEVVVK